VGVCDGAHRLDVMKKIRGWIAEGRMSRSPTHRKERDEWGTGMVSRLTTGEPLALL
jgi:hypothetical protein